MRDGEENEVRPAQKKIQQTKIPAGVQDEETHLEHGMRHLVAPQVLSAVIFQHECLEQRQREERKMLIFHGKPREPVFSGDLVLRKCKRKQIHVGVRGNVVRRAMMVIVLPEPPTVAESEQEIRMKQAQGLVSNRPVENFLMARVVNDETQLSEHKRQESGIAKFR